MNISKSRILFKNPTLLLFYLYSPLTSCKKSEKSLEPFLSKLLYQPANQPTNQPIITNNTDLIGSRWRQSKINLKFYFHNYLCTSNRFHKWLLWNLSKASQVSMKMKINVSFYHGSGLVQNELTALISLSLGRC